MANTAPPLAPPQAPTTTNANPPVDTAAIASAAQTQAASQVQSEIAAQTTPIQEQIGGLQTQEGQAVQGIGSMFNQLQPTVNQGAKVVGAAYNDATAAESQIFSAANAAMSQLRQSRAQEAQMMAQQIGGPVALGAFDEGFGSAATALINEGAGQQLHTLGIAQAGVQSANAFAGQVFPLLRTEQTANARTFYENQIKDLNTKITDLRSQAPAQINSRQQQIEAQQLDYQMKVAQFKLDALNAHRDYQLKVSEDAATKVQNDRQWQQTQATIKNQEAQTAAQVAGLTGVYDGKPTLEATKLSADEKLAAQTAGLSEKNYELNLKSLNESTKIATAKLKADQQVTANSYLDAAVNPQPGKTVTTTQAIPVPALAATTGKAKDAYKDPKSSTGYSKLVTVVDTPTSTPITDPDDLVDYLVAHGTGKALAINMVRKRLALSDSWTYGRALIPDHLSGRDNNFGSLTGPGVPTNLFKPTKRALASLPDTSTPGTRIKA